MPLKRNDLFGWERFSKPRVYSRSQRVNTESDVQDWIKTVEDASESAAAATFGEKHGRVKNGHMDRTTANAAISDMHIHDAAYNEAQDLLQHWVAEKLDFDTELEFTDETWNQQKTEAEIKSEWDHLLLDDDDPCFGGLESGILNSSHIKAKLEEDDIYGQLDDDNEAAVVDSILQKMLDKEVVSKAVIQDLGVGDSVKQHIDPRTKMQMRHLQVKTNREKRLKEKETKLEQLRIKKDAQFKARHLLQKEEQQKAAEAKREEMEIQREMAHIRKEMENERKKGEEDRQRLLRAQREKERVLREHMMREQAFEKDGQREAEQHAEERQRLMLKRIEEIQARETRRRLKTLQRHFSMWYRLVVDRRMKMGKARAMADWRLVLRAWTTWRTYVQNHKLDIEAQQHDVYMRELHRKQMAAQEHYKQTLEKKCFTAWQLYLTQAQQLSIIEEKQKLTKNKIANFLNAAATGKLWSGRSDGDDLRRSRSFGDINQSSDSTQKRVDEMFEQTTCKRPASARMEMPAGRSDKHFHRGRTKNGVDIPSEPWQVSRKHLKLTKEQLAMLGGRRGDVTHLALPAGSEEERNTKRAWEKTPFTPSTFEHRYTAQQKALSMQQKQLKEQQRLITDLQYLQRQQLLQQQAVQQQLVQQRVDGVAMATGDAVVKATPMPLQKHLSRLQEEVLRKEGGDVSGLRGNVGSETSGGIARPESAVTSGGDNGSSRTARSVVSATGSNASSSHTVKHAQFVKAMEQRAAERARLKQDREERKRKMEDEKVMRLEAEMMEKLKEEEEEKRLKQEAYRERKRVEKLREKEHVEQVERMKQLTALAADHYQKAVVKFRGWRPWRALVTQMREKTDRAEKHYNSTVVRKCFTSWRVTVKEELEEKKALACGLHRRHLMLRCFGSWKKFGQYTAIQEERAIKFYERNLLTRILVEWAEYATEEKVAMWRKEKHAKEHNTRRMQRITFTAWLKFPRLAREQMEKEKRRQRMRQKVASMLPDFQPSAHVNKSIDLL